MTIENNEVWVTQPRASKVLRQIDDLFYEQIPDANRIATSNLYRNDVDTVCAAARTGDVLAGGLVGHGPRPQSEVLQQLGPIDEVTRRVRLIAEVAVSPDCRRRGVGRALVDYTENEFRKSDGAIVLAFVDDLSTNDSPLFWEQMGYSEQQPVKALTSPPQGWLPPEAGLYRGLVIPRAGRFFVKHLI